MLLSAWFAVIRPVALTAVSSDEDGEEANAATITPYAELLVLPKNAGRLSLGDDPPLIASLPRLLGRLHIPIC